MKINHRIDFLEGAFDTDTDRLICVSNKKYGRVSLCLEPGEGGMSIGIAQIKLYSSNLAVDADAVFADACNLAQEIERRWRACPELLRGLADMRRRGVIPEDDQQWVEAMLQKGGR